MARKLRASLGLAYFALGFSAPSAAELPAPVCNLVLHEEANELADLELQVELERSGFAAFGRICDLIDKLWEGEAIDRMTWLRARYDRDAARLALERSAIRLERQRALIEQYELVCGAGEAANRDTEIERAHRRYLRADCDQQAKAVEVARTNLEFRREWLASVRDLRAGDVATAQDVILAELDVEREEHSLADATARTAHCRAAQAPAAEPD